MKTYRNYIFELGENEAHVENGRLVLDLVCEFPTEEEMSLLREADKIRFRGCSPEIAEMLTIELEHKVVLYRFLNSRI